MHGDASYLMKKSEFDQYPSTSEEIEAIAQIAKISKESIHGAQRDQHPKQHGCVWAEFEVLDNLPEKLRKGVFSEPQVFLAWIRFSSFREDDDTKKDVNGMAIKLMEVEGKKVLKGEEDAKTQDFILITPRTFFVKNAQDFAELLAHNSIPKFIFPSLFKWRLREARSLISTRLKHLIATVTSPLETQYWSTTPYQLGDSKIKFFVKPSPNNLSNKKPGKSKNFLREVMADYLRTQTAYFDFYVQLQDQENPNRTPIDDPRVEWRNVETYKVATIKIPSQIFDSPEQDQFGENLSFTPWHCLPEHTPLGSINYARKEVYWRTALLRRRLNHVPQAEPNPDTFSPHLLPCAPLNDKSAPQRALTAIIPIRSDKAVELAEYLERKGQNNECPSSTLFDKSVSTHFARFVILNDFEQGLKPHLLFSSNYDGDFSAYMQELVETIGSDLHHIFSMCEGFDHSNLLCAVSLTAFIKHHSFDAQVFYCAFPQKTVSMIRNNHFLHVKLKQILGYLDSLELEAKLQRLYPYLSTNASSNQAPKETRNQAIEFLFYVIFKMLESWVGIEHSAEQDPSKRLTLTSEQQTRLRQITKLEDNIAQNQITVLTPIKPGCFHKFFLILILFVTSIIVQITQFFASSSAPQLPVIHFARWVIIDRKKIQGSQHSYLLFESNYNQSWDSYIDDFVENFGSRMNLIWGNCTKFPAGGTQDIAWFKQYIRKHQYPAQIFYSAYPNSTVSTIQKEIEIQDAACQFLKLLHRQEVKQFFTGS